MLLGACTLMACLPPLLHKECILTLCNCRPRPLRSRTPPPPRHPRLRLNPRLPPLQLVHLRQSTHRPTLLRARRPALPAHRQPARRQQVLPALYLQPTESAEPAHTTCFHKVLRPARIPLVAVAQFLGTTVAECGEGRSESVAPVEESLCGGFEGC
jgi:hypothetical protein